MAIGQPRLATGYQRAALCARCHRAPPGFPDGGSDFIRFQSPNMARSRCFVESAGALDCTTCHNPHRNAATEAAGYERICLHCHGAQELTSIHKDQSTPSSRLIPGRPCPVDSSKGCLPCHMPSVPNVLPHTAYTDHFIRVRRD
jgi:hypothetical protein